MPIITFWSNNKKTIGQSVAASLAATVMSMEHNYKVLLVSADYNNQAIENCFGAQESNKEILKKIGKKNQINLDSGIKGLLKLGESNRVTPEVIHDYTKIIFKNRLEILYSPMYITNDKKNDVMENIRNIIANASRYYDYVIVDLKKGLELVQQNDILQMSDVIVNNINQNIKEIQELLELQENNGFMNKSLWNICKYESKSKYNSKNLARTILKKQKIYETAYNTLVLDAAQEGNIVELLIRLRTLKDEDENSVLIKKTEELIQGILLKYQETRTRM